MKIFLVIILIVNVSLLLGQRVELYTGANKNSFYGSKDLHSSSYKSGFGFSVGIGLDSLIFGKLKTRFALQFDSYQGSLMADVGGVSYAERIDAKVNKSTIGFCFFPLNVRIKKKIDFNLGVELSHLVYEKYSGVLKGFDPYNPSYSYDLNEKYKSFSSKMHLGIKARINYDIYISNSVAISPQYLFYLGTSPEFNKFPGLTKSMRHYACLGIRKKINKS
jgi:hypothetical protein